MKPVAAIYTVWILCLLMGASPVSAGDSVRMELMDGSVISGEIISMKGGVYSISTKSLGTLKIDEGDIRGIRFGKAGKPIDAAVPAEGAMRETIKSLQNEMLSDEQILNMILSIQNDPDIQKLLNDPDLLRAVSSGDLNALMANPDFVKIINHATIRTIRNQLTQP